MRLPRIQFTVRRVMIAIATVSLLLAVFMHRERIRKLNQMVIDQDITKDSAEANFMNAVLAREAAEHALDEYTEQHDGLRAEVPRSETSSARISADHSHPLAKYDAELATRRNLSQEGFRQLGEETDIDAGGARQAALTALMHYIKTLDRQLSATQASQLATAQSHRETAARHTPRQNRGGPRQRTSQEKNLGL